MPIPQTIRLYYDDAGLTDFDATIVELRDGGRIVVLDRTAFYPTSGGQPHDLGTLGGIAIGDVVDEEAVIAHHLAAPVAAAVGATVSGHIDTVRRFDHMQQHTGQHLLSAWLTDRYGWPTVSVHFGDEASTVDVAMADGAAVPTSEELAVIEREINACAVADHRVTVSYEEASTAIGLRKASDRDGVLRLVTIDGLDRSACGGTHVSSTGAIGPILLRRAERSRGNLRIEFLCGHRAIARARRDADLLVRTARPLSASADELPGLVDQMQQRLTELERERKRLLLSVAVFEAEQLWHEAPVDASGRRVIRRQVEGTVRDHEPLAQSLTQRGGCVVLFTTESGGVLYAASADTGVDAGQRLKPALAAVGGRGGGSPKLAQGTVPPERLADLVSALLGSS